MIDYAPRPASTGSRPFKNALPRRVAALLLGLAALFGFVFAHAAPAQKDTYIFVMPLAGNVESNNMIGMIERIAAVAKEATGIPFDIEVPVYAPGDGVIDLDATRGQLDQLNAGHVNPPTRRLAPVHARQGPLQPCHGRCFTKTGRRLARQEQRVPDFKAGRDERLAEIVVRPAGLSKERSGSGAGAGRVGRGGTQ